MSITEEIAKLKKSQRIGLVICIILMVLQIVLQIIRLASVTSLSAAASPIVIIFLIIGFGYYALFGYKKPHGNMLRYLFLFYVIWSCYFLLKYVQANSFYVNALGMVKIVALAYVAGRLDKFKQNKFILSLLVLIDSFYVIRNIYTIAAAGMLTFGTFIVRSSSLLFTVSVVLAYVIRYDLHKEAGLQDK